MDDARRFGNCIASSAAGHALSDDDIAVVRDAIQTYPWFMTARLVYAAAGGGDDVAVRLHHSAYGRRPDALKEIMPGELERYGTAGCPSVRESAVRGDDIIDRFLLKGEYRIVPDDGAPDEDAAAESADFDLSGDLVSEELAQIYLAQGLNSHAKKIYERLSLLNPEKSIYFAEIIERIGNKASGKKLR